MNQVVRSAPRFNRFLAFTLVLQLVLSALCFGAEAKHFYLLSKPVDTDIKLGRVARIVHPIIVGAMAVGYTAALYSRTGEPLAILSFVGYEVVKAPAMILRNTIVDLKVRQAWARRKLLSEISDIPGVKRFSVLTTGYLAFEGTYASRQRNTGYVFVESEDLLEAKGEWVEKFGAPIEVSDLAETRLSLRLTHEGSEHTVAWETTLKEILDKKAMPDEVAVAWAKHLDELGKARSWRERFSKKYEENLEVVTKLTLPNGETREIGTLLRGKSVRKLLGLTLPRRFWSFLKATFLRSPQGIDPQPLPLCERIVKGD